MFFPKLLVNIYTTSIGEDVGTRLHHITHQRMHTFILYEKQTKKPQELGDDEKCCWLEQI